MAEEDPPEVENVLRAMIEPYFSSESSSLRTFIAAFDFATVRVASIEDLGKIRLPTHVEIVINDEAAFKGIIWDGVRVGEPGSSSAWLVNWLREEGIDLPSLFPIPSAESTTPRQAFQMGAKLRLSDSLLSHVLPTASALAEQTIGNDRARLRHFTFALLSEAPLKWLDPSFTEEQERRLKRKFVERTIAAHKASDNADAWRRAAFFAEDEPSASQSESVVTHSDAPALVDSLGRQAFAEVLGARIKDIGTKLRNIGGADSAFILHMDGPWGSGKSSVLNFLKADLESVGWLVVEFNAWRNQHRRPAWLPLILQVRRSALWSLTPWTPLVWLAWLWWRIRMDWLSYMIAFALISVAAFLVWGAGAEGVGQGVLGLKSTEEALRALGAILAAVGSFIAMARGFTLGSHRNAEAYLECKSEPFRRIVRYFGWLVSATHRPVAVFIDDLDRCDSSYVIDLLEGIQTSLRAAPITYVVAGDRKWICSSFEMRYADFCGEIGTPGRPLGYMFLDKVFQLSTSLPQLSIQRQAQYWRQLLERTDRDSPQAQRQERLRLEDDAMAGLEGKTTQEDIQIEIDKTKEGSVERETLLAVAAKQTASPEAARAAEHRLQPLAPLLEANPRAMKRLVNAYGLNQARAYLENRNVLVEALARWTIIELRWPLLAEFIVRTWPEIDLVAPDESIPEPFREMLRSREVASVIGKARAKGRLIRRNLAPILD